MYYAAMSYIYGRRSRTNLSQCHPDLQTLFNVVIKSVDCSVICGSRSKADQDKAVAERKSKAPWPTSNHNVDGVKRRTAWAADVCPYPIDWDDRKRFERFAAIVLKIAVELLAAGEMQYEVRNGGDWDRDGIFDDWDMPHFELLNVTPGE